MEPKGGAGHRSDSKLTGAMGRATPNSVGEELAAKES